MPGSALTLSEAVSKALMRAHGVSVVDDREVADAAAAAAAADELGYPVVVKLCGDAITHKTERGLVRLRLTSADEVVAAGTGLLAASGPDDGAVSLLVAPMITGHRELIAGLVRDPQFGMNVMVGLGGIFAEAVGDVVFCPVPVSAVDAADMIEDLGAQALLGPFRGEPPVDRQELAAVLTGLSDLAVARPDVVSADLNPLIVVDGRPVAVDALVELEA